MMNLDPKTYSYVSKKSNNLILIAVGYIALLLTWFFGSSDKVYNPSAGISTTSASITWEEQ